MVKISKNITLKQLYNNQALFTKVQALIAKGKTFDFILEFLGSEGKPMSRGTLANLKSKLEESQETGKPIGELIDWRSKNSITQVDPKKITGYTGDKPTDIVTDNDVTGDATQKFFGTEEVLDEIIRKGKETLDATDIIDLPLLIKALDMKQKDFGDESHGLSLDALKQYQVITEARYKAVLDTMLAFIPEDKQDQAMAKMNESFDEATKNLEVSADGKRLITALSKRGLSLK